MLLWASGDIIELTLANEDHGLPMKDDSLRGSWRAEVMVDGDGPPIHQNVHNNIDSSREISHPVSLACPERPYDRLMVRANGTEAGLVSHFAGLGGASKAKATASLFVPEVECKLPIENTASAKVIVYFRSTAKCVGPEKHLQPSYLGVDIASGRWCAGPRRNKANLLEQNSHPTICCAFAVSKSCKALRLEEDISKKTRPASWRDGEDAPFFIPSWKLRRFVREGFVVLPGVIPVPELRACQKVLTRFLGVPGAVVAGGTQSGLGKVCGAASSCAEVRALLQCAGVCAALDQVLGPDWGDRQSMHPLSGQVAMRFPEHTHLSTEDLESAETREHILKSYAWHTDGFRRGKFHEFSVLLGVCLSDCTDDFSGNLLVWPETHALIHSCLVGKFGDIDLPRLAELSSRARGRWRENTAAGPSSEIPTPGNSLPLGARLLTAKGEGEGGIEENSAGQSAAYLQSEGASGDPLSAFLTRKHSADDAWALPDLGSPEQVKMRAGDIVLLHPELAHAGGPNLTSAIRTMVYFRIRAMPAGEDDACRAHLSNMWSDFRGLAAREGIVSTSYPGMLNKSQRAFTMQKSL